MKTSSIPESGILPAAVTPFTPSGEVDTVSLARLLAYFEAAGCSGVVIGGTNGEGPSLSAVEKRDTVRQAVTLAGRLPVIAGIATASLTEAVWLAQQAEKAGTAGLLVMPPGYFRSVEISAIAQWFEALMDASGLPLLAYNFPKMTGITLTPEFFERVSKHSRFAGLKDSSGEIGNIASYRAALGPEHRLWVGNELLLPMALEAGWSGSISGASNTVPTWLVRVAHELRSPDLRESGTAKFELLAPILEFIRSQPQPALHKQVLHAFGILATPDVRLPLTAPDAVTVEMMLASLRSTLGIYAEGLGLPIGGVQ